jgi:hypothetical protein
MQWFELAIAALFGAAFTAFRLYPGTWCEPMPVRLIAGLFIVATAASYLFFVDDGRRPKVGPWHRVLVGAGTGLVVAAIASGSGELYALLGLAGAICGYLGFELLKHVPL